ncbi:hypothetical protein GF342_02175 [Candidatus Woesearchaeota archaeon]|nr:hypothetical protein [Candidatus Woesearchaeota archaeon]
MSSYAHQQLHTAYFTISLAKAIGYYQDHAFELKQYNEAMLRLRELLKPVQPILEVSLMDSGFALLPMHDGLKQVNFMPDYFSPAGGRAESIDYPAIIHANVRKVMADIAFATVPEHQKLQAFFEQVSKAPQSQLQGTLVLATGRHVHVETTELAYDTRYQQKIKAVLQQIVEMVEEMMKHQHVIPYNPQLPHYQQRTDAVYMKNEEQVIDAETITGPVLVSLPLGKWFDVRIALAALPAEHELHQMHGPLKKSLQQVFI